MTAAPSPRRLLLVNGNASPRITERLAAHARGWFPAIDVTAVTPAFGPRYVSTPIDYAVAGHAASEAFREAVAGHATGHFGAGLVACFGEPGIAAARALGAMPVAGMAEAAVLSALQLGERYAIVTIGAAWPGMLRGLLRQYGLLARCGEIVAIDGDALSASADQRGIADRVAGAVAGISDRGTADVVILGGAALAGLADDMRATSPLPLVCSLRAGVAQALALAEISAERA
jgi:allantoin racemase